MNAIKTVFASLLSLASLAACSGATESPAQDPSNDNKETVRESLSFTAPCTGTTCGAVPSTSTASKPACVPTGNTCGWSDDSAGNSGSVSYRQCAKTECTGTEPTAATCPSGTTFKGNTCGSENNAACKWTTICAPPRSTTPCPDPNACGEMSLVGVICKDGSNGTQNCMKVGETRCAWQPSCD